MVNIKAEIIADSVNESGSRLTTFILQFPRIVLAEFNTHRMISKNSASSRAIPFSKMSEMVRNNPFIPIAFQKTHSGMQGSECFEGDDHLSCVEQWLIARNSAVEQATKLHTKGITKQLCNRVLEPFMYHTVICTGTEWENYFSLRAHPAAEIHIADLAEKMLKEYNSSTPKVLLSGEWHIPFGDKFDDSRLVRYTMNSSKDELDELKVKIATARCARVSYQNFEGKDDYNADIKLHDILASQGHWSPFEHCAMAVHNETYYGNFKGFKQYRKSFINENKSDERVNKVY